MTRNRILPISLSLALCGCAVGPSYEKPEVKAPEAHRGEATPQGQAAPTTASFSDLPWWEVFRDPVMARYLKQSLSEAYDVRMAAARIEQSRARAKAAMWAYMPTMYGNVAVGGGQGFPGVPTMLPAQSMNGVFGASVTASWEADVWGRLRRQKEAADADAQAADEDRRAVWVALVGDVASTYTALRTNDLKLEILKAAITVREETLAFFTERAKGGVGNELEVARAQGNVADAQARSVDVERFIWLNENLLSLLLAKGPGSIERGAALDALQLLPEVPAGLPSALIDRRPDIRRASAELHAITAEVGVQIGDVLPMVVLTGTGGVASSDLGALVDSGDGIYRGTAGLSIPLPILGGATDLTDIEEAKARVREYVALYEKIVMNALREVSDALKTVQLLKDARGMREAQVAALRRAEEVAMLRYRGGVATYLEVVTSQEERLNAELLLADLKGEQHQAVIALYRALGGGWNMNTDKDSEKESGR